MTELSLLSWNFFCMATPFT